MIKQYKSWNIFERRYFWSGILYISLFGGYSLNLMANPVYNSSIYYRLGVITVMMMLCIHSIKLIKNSLLRWEMEWKGIVIDPITNKKISPN